MRKANGLDEFYSRNLNNDGCELFVDKNGNPTIDYPHVHIIHKGDGNVDIVSSTSSGNQVYRKSLSQPDGNTVEEYVGIARSYL